MVVVTPSLMRTIAEFENDLDEAVGHGERDVVDGGPAHGLQNADDDWPTPIMIVYIWATITADPRTVSTTPPSSSPVAVEGREEAADRATQGSSCLACLRALSGVTRSAIALTSI